MIGQTLSHYRIIEKIGAGGMGEVYRAYDERLERDVALKVLPAGTLADEAARKRFRKEALALSKLNHPNIETVHDFDTQDGVDFLVMEYIPGLTLSEKLERGPLPEKEIAHLGTQMAEGLAAAHAQGIVHRDIKPGNLRVTPEGRLEILDFGIAKLLGPVSGPATTESFTETQAAAGTLPYMAPEQLRGQPVDARSDVYAAGVVLYEMATGRRPFEEKLVSALTDAILHQPPPPPGRLKHDLSARLEEIILKCLEKDPENRYQSAKELTVDLRRLMTPTAAVARRRVPLDWAPRLRLVGLGAAVAAAVLAVVLGLFYLRPAAALSEGDYVLLTDFINHTNDPIFDGTLKQGLTVKLEESPFLRVFPERRVRETLISMQRSPDEPLTPALGGRKCVCAGASRQWSPGRLQHWEPDTYSLLLPKSATPENHLPASKWKRRAKKT